MAARKRETAPVKAMLYIGPEGVLYDGEDKAVAFLEPGFGNSEMVLRIVESVNALAGYSLDEIRRGAFRAGTQITGSNAFTFQNGSGNSSAMM
jgi:hypothetical protein